MLIVVCMFKVYKVIETTRKNDIFQNLDFLLMILIDGYKSKMQPSLHWLFRSDLLFEGEEDCIQVYGNRYTKVVT